MSGTYDASRILRPTYHGWRMSVLLSVGGRVPGEGSAYCHVKRTCRALSRAAAGLAGPAAIRRADTVAPAECSALVEQAGDIRSSRRPSVVPSYRHPAARFRASHASTRRAAAAALLSVAIAGYLVSAVLGSFHATVLGVAFGPVDTVFIGMGLLAVAGGFYARVALRDVIAAEDAVKEDVGEGRGRTSEHQGPSARGHTA